MQSGKSTPPTRIGSITPPEASVMPARRPYLYVGQLSAQVNDVVLREVFSTAGPVHSTKIVVDRTSQYAAHALNYGFVEFADVRSAELALQKLNGRKIFESEIKVDWAASSLIHGTGTGNGLAGGGGGGGGSSGGIGGLADSSISSLTTKENTSNHFHVFVGDLAQEINDAGLQSAFQSFPSLSEARIMWDVTSGKSRGYGFVAFRDKTDAEQAIATMNGEWIGSRAIRVNWANQKGSGNTLLANSPHAAAMGHRSSLGGSSGGGSGGAMSAMLAGGGGMAAFGMGGGGGGLTSMPPTGGAASGTPISYDQVLASSPPHNTTVYVGNIAPIATQNDLIPLFSQYGYILEIRMQPDRGFAFVKLDTHENAANAIVNLAGQIACGRPIKCGWGKDRNESAMFNALRLGAGGVQLSGYGGGGGGIAPAQAMFGSMPQYNFPAGFAAAAAAAAYPLQAGGTGGMATAHPTGLPGQMDLATLQHLQLAQSQAAQQHHHHHHQQQLHHPDQMAAAVAAIPHMAGADRQQQSNAALQYLQHQQAFVEANDGAAGLSNFTA